MPSSTTGSLLPDDDFNRLQKIADEFATARHAGPLADWFSFVPERDDRLHRPVLRELVKIDLEIGWREDNGLRLESYVDQFPGLDPLPVELIVEEYRVRHLYGDKPTLDEYQTRFPESFAEIKRKVAELPAKSETPAAPTIAKPGASPPPPPSSNTGPIFPDGYKPIERLGHGNFGEVWRAEAPGGVEVAIKVVSQPLDHDAAQRELQALELIKKLQHPTLLSTYAFWVIQNHLVIVMELADGSLRDRLKECKQKGLAGIPPDELLSYFHDAAVGLDYLHWQKVLHRDIKPENILLKKGYAKVADFGLARAQSGAMMSVSFAGTPAFMAPEVWGGKINERSDQYSLAFTYAELRLGRRPLEGNDFVAVMVSAQEGEPDLGDLPQTEQTVLRRALAKRPEERFDTCEDFVEALDRALSPDGRTARRRPSQVQRLKPGSATGTERTELSGRADVAVKKPTAVETTVTGESAGVEDTPKNKPALWKPAGPTAPPATAPRVMLFAIVGVLGIGLLAFLGWYVFIHDGGAPVATDTSDKGSSETKRTSNGTPPKTTPKNGVPPPVEKTDFMPTRLVKAAGAKLIPHGTKKYYDKLAYKLKDGSEAVFILMSQNLPGDQRPFYMMENKVWNALFAEYLQEGSRVAEAWKDDNPSWPVRNVTLTEAEQCARWLDNDFGKLPTPRQWDYAAGFWQPRDGRTGPALPGARPAVGLTAPLPVKRDHDDVSPFGIRDMSGNGREFTRQRVRDHQPALVVLRGRMLTLGTPLTYTRLQEEQDEARNLFQTQYADKPSPQTGFRIVIEVPE